MKEKYMKLSHATREILSHFATQGQNFVFTAGKRQSMLTSNRSRLVIADIEDEMPVQAGIADLKKFVSCMNTFDEPELTFGENYASLLEGATEAKFCLSDLESLIYPASELKFPGNGLQFKLNEESVKKILKYLKVMSYKELAIESRCGKVVARVLSAPQSDEDQLEISLGLCEQDFSLSLDVEGLNLIPDSYDLFLSDKALVKLKSTTKELTYFLAVNKIVYMEKEEAYVEE
jgi:hypothetical protein